MKVFTTFRRLMPTTVDGEIIKVTTYYSSFDGAEIDRLHEDLKNTIGAGVVTEFVPDKLKDPEFRKEWEKLLDEEKQKGEAK